MAGRPAVQMPVLSDKNRLLKELATNLVIDSLSRTIINTFIIIIRSLIDAEVLTEAAADRSASYFGRETLWT